MYEELIDYLIPLLLKLHLIRQISLALKLIEVLEGSILDNPKGNNINLYIQDFKTLYKLLIKLMVI